MLFLYLCMYIEYHTFTPGPQVPVLYHRVHSSFLSCHTYNSFLFWWESWISLSLVQWFSHYACVWPVSHHLCLCPLPWMIPHLSQSVTAHAGPPPHMGYWSLCLGQFPTLGHPLYASFCHLWTLILCIQLYLCREVLFPLLVLWRPPSGFRTNGKGQDSSTLPLIM